MKKKKKKRRRRDSSYVWSFFHTGIISSYILHMYMRFYAVCVCSINKISGRPSFKSLCLKCRQEEIRKRSVSTSFFF